MLRTWSASIVCSAIFRMPPRLDAELSRAELELVDVSKMLAMLSEHSSVDDAAHPPLAVKFSDDQELRVNANADRLMQVFRNLIDNATSFSPPACSIVLKASRNGRSIEVAVEDQGPGIPEGKLNEVFDRFYTERPSGEKFRAENRYDAAVLRILVSDSQFPSRSLKCTAGPSVRRIAMTLTVLLWARALSYACLPSDLRQSHSRKVQ